MLTVNDLQAYIATLDPMEAMGQIEHLSGGYRGVLELHAEGTITLQAAQAYAAVLTPALLLLARQISVPGGTLPIHPQPGECLCKLLGYAFEGSNDAHS